MTIKKQFLTITLLILLKFPPTLQNDTCLKSKQCRECVRGNCLKCSFGYRTEKKLCTRSKHKIEFCASYLHEGKCIECEKGYYLDFGICLKCKNKNCAICPRNTCIACFNGIKMEEKCGLKKCEIENCEICLFNDFCDVCRDGYGLRENNGNYFCQETQHHCLNIGSDQEKCSACGVFRVLDEDSFCVSMALIAFSGFWAFFLVV